MTGSPGGVRRAMAWTFAGQAASLLATFGATVALARILSPLEIGIYAVGLAVSGVLQALSSFGVAAYVVRERSLADGVLETAFTVNAIVSAALAAALLGLSCSGRATMGQPMVGEVLRLLAVAPLIAAVEFRPATMLQREMDFRRIALVGVSRTVATAVVSIAAALAGASALSAAYGAVAGGAVAAAGFSLAARRHVGFRMAVRGWRSMAAFGFKTLAIGGVSVVVYRLSDVLLGAMAGLAALGVFNRAAALSGMVVQNVYANIAKVLFVKLADDERAGLGVGPAYLRGLEMTLAVMWPLLAGLAVLAAPAVEILFGPRWRAAAAPFAILSGASALGLTFAMNYELFVLRDQVGRQARLEVVRAAAGLAAFAYGASFGLVGAALGRVVDPLVGMVLYLPRLRVLAGVPRGGLARTYARNAAVALAATAPAAALMAWWGWSPETPPSALALATAAGGLCWLAALRLLRHPLYAEVASQAARLVPRGAHA